VKLLGALLVIGGAAALGHLEAVRREKRARELAAVITALELLESHVVYGQVLLADALRRVGEAQPGAGWAFLRAAERLEEGWPASRALRDVFFGVGGAVGSPGERPRAVGPTWLRSSACRRGAIRPGTSAGPGASWR